VNDSVPAARILFLLRKTDRAQKRNRRHSGSQHVFRPIFHKISLREAKALGETYAEPAASAIRKRLALREMIGMAARIRFSSAEILLG
jgi:hypothetical protein